MCLFMFYCLVCSSDAIKWFKEAQEHQQAEYGSLNDMRFSENRWDQEDQEDQVRGALKRRPPNSINCR